MNLQNFKSNFLNIENAVIMGNGPSLNQYNFDELSKKNTIFLACNRISNLFFEKKLNWRPDIYTCFTSTSLKNNEWKTSIDRCLIDDKIVSFVHHKYKKFSNITKFHNNIFFCEGVFEHNRHKKIHKDFINMPLESGFLKSYSATVTLFQICDWLNIQNIFIVGQDGYTKKYGKNHFSKTYKFEPDSFKKSNSRIIDVHTELKRYFKNKGVSVYNSSKGSILEKIYEYKDLRDI